MKSILTLFLLVLCGGIIAGCDSNPTNEPTQASIDAANATRLKAIQDDPKMSEADKQKMIEMLKLGGEKSAADRGK